MDSVKMRTLVVDRQRRTRQRILKLLEEDRGVEAIGECRNADEAIEAIEAQAPDLIILEVARSGIDGFQVLERVEPEPQVILVADSDAFALRSYDFNAIDYLVKPVDGARLARALQRAKSLIVQKKVMQVFRALFHLLENYSDQEPFPGELRQPDLRKEYLRRMPLKKHGRVAFLEASQIEWIESANQYVRLHLDTKTHLLRESMKSLEGKLDPNQFMRIHRSAIINLARVKELEVDPPVYGVVLQDGTHLRVSRSRYDELQRILTTLP